MTPPGMQDIENVEGNDMHLGTKKETKNTESDTTAIGKK